MITATNNLTAKISAAASKIAGAIYDDATGTVDQRLEFCIGWKNQGSDGELTSEDRNALGLLLDALTGITSDLYDSDAASVIREATEEEAIKSALAGPEGHILVNSRRCYVSL